MAQMQTSVPNRSSLNSNSTESYEKTDLVVFSHLRYDFVFQRPQHLMNRYAAHRRVFFIEEPIFGTTEAPRVHIREHGNVRAVIPHLPHGLPPEQVEMIQRELVDELIEEENIRDYTVWYYTPMALSFSRHLQPRAVIFDVMDELSMFKHAPKTLLDNEAELMRRSDLVFTGGQSLYEAKKHRHPSVHAFPSSIDRKHFGQARGQVEEPADQKSIPHPRFGFFGVIDERMNIELVGEMAALRPDWQFVFIGPVVKIDPATLPQAKNIHYLGKKEYVELPSYLATWDVAIMPFALNDSTKFISPTKTPEFLAAGCPVVSTPIKDVVSPYGDQKLVHIAETAEQFVAAAELALKQREDSEWLARVDQFLSDKSWDNTWHDMAVLENRVCQAQERGAKASAMWTKWEETPVVASLT